MELKVSCAALRPDAQVGREEFPTSQLREPALLSWPVEVFAWFAYRDGSRPAGNAGAQAVRVEMVEALLKHLKRTSAHLGSLR